MEFTLFQKDSKCSNAVRDLKGQTREIEMAFKGQVAFKGQACEIEMAFKGQACEIELNCIQGIGLRD